MALILEDGTGIVDSNSYEDEAGASAYLSNLLYVTPWTEATVEDREKALIYGTSLINRLMSWKATKTSFAQALDFPRTGLYDKDGYLVESDEIPKRLKQATAEMALSLIVENRTAERSYGVEKIKVDVIEIQNSLTDEKPVIPESVMDLIKDYGVSQDRDVGIRSGIILRS